MTKQDFMQTDLKSGNSVQYVPRHARDNPNHPDREFGIVSTVGVSFVFVKFPSGVKACRASQLILLNS